PLLPVFRRNAEGTTIPYNRMKAGIANAAGGRLRGKGYLDLMGVDIDTFLPPLVKTLPGIIIGKVPGPSKINPAGTCKLWTWMNRSIPFLHSYGPPSLTTTKTPHPQNLGLECRLVSYPQSL